MRSISEILKSLSSLAEAGQDPGSRARTARNRIDTTKAEIAAREADLKAFGPLHREGAHARRRLRTLKKEIAVLKKKLERELAVWKSQRKGHAGDSHD